MLMTKSPFFSVIVPTYRRPEALANLLRGILFQHCPMVTYEVIVVDDGGCIPLGSTISQFNGDLALTLLRQNNAGPAAARNHGARSARGKFLAFIDDDCIPTPGWLYGLAQVFRSAPEALCGGTTKNALIDNLFSETTHALIDYVYQEYKPADNMGAFFLANNLAVSRNEFSRIGGFDPSLRFGEDREFCHRWVSNRRPLVFAPNALIHHAHPLTPASFLYLHFHYGRGTVMFKRRCAWKGLKPIKVSPPSYYFKLVLSGMRREKGSRGLLISALLLISQLSYVSGYAWEAVRNLRMKRACLNDLAD